MAVALNARSRIVVVFSLGGTATWALGLIVGINLITSGLAITMVALAERSLVRTLADATR